MHHVRFTEQRRDGNDLLLHGPLWRARVQLLPVGVWRLCVWQRPEDAPKSSLNVAAMPGTAFDADVDADGMWRLAAPGAEPLDMCLAPFSWTWNGMHAESLESQRRRPLRQLPDRAHAPGIDGNALAEVNDGLPLGGGLTLTLHEPRTRRCYGLGERTGFLDKKGRIWENWTTDEFNHTPRQDPLYQAHPFLLTLDGGTAAGVFLDETWRTLFDLGASEPERTLIHTDGPTFDLYLIPGPEPKDVLRRFTELVGRAPMPPLWALGFHQCRWGYANETTVRAVVEEYRQHRIPLDAIWLDIDYMDGYKVFTFSPDRFPDPAALTADLRRKGVRTVVIVDPGVKKEPGYAVYESGHTGTHYVRNARDEEFVDRVWPAPAVWPDFTRADVRAWWGEWHRVYVEAGVAGIWNDMNEPSAFGTPSKTLPEAARHGAHTHAEMHNVYGSSMCRATRDGLQRLAPDRRPFVLTRSGFSGIQKHAWVWTGDNHSYWEHLEACIPMLLNLGLSGVPFVGCDIGGFSDDADAELATRWTWLAAFFPFMRNHAGKATRRQEAYAFGEPYTSAMRAAIEQRYRLLPTLYTLARQATEDGLPIMRPLLLDYPQDPDTAAMHDQFLCGPDLLVAPILRPGQTHRLVYLPEGRWQDMRAGTVHTGPTRIVASAGLDSIPLFQRAGSAVALAAPTSHTSTALWETLVWRIVPATGIDSGGCVYEDDGDGPANGTLRTLSAQWDGDCLHLAQSGPRADRPATVEMCGVRKPTALGDGDMWEADVLSLVLNGARERTVTVRPLERIGIPSVPSS